MGRYVDLVLLDGANPEVWVLGSHADSLLAGDLHLLLEAEGRERLKVPRDYLVEPGRGDVDANVVEDGALGNCHCD